MPSTNHHPGTLNTGTCPIGFGTAQLANHSTWPHSTNRRHAIRLLREAISAGVTHIDTADAHGPHTVETLIRHALHPYPDNLVIATKGGMTRNPTNRWAVCGHPEYLRQCVENSLKRLRTDHIHLYYLHRIDPTVALEDQLGALQDFQAEGKIGHIGLCNITLEQLLTATTLATIAAVSNRYNIIDQTSDDIIHYCEYNNIMFVPHAPLAAGSIIRSPSLARIAETCGATSAQLALAWLLHRSPRILPVPATTQMRHLYENLEAIHINLNRTIITSIDLLTTPQWPPPTATIGA